MVLPGSRPCARALWQSPGSSQGPRRALRAQLWRQLQPAHRRDLLQGLPGLHSPSVESLAQQQVSVQMVIGRGEAEAWL